MEVVDALAERIERLDPPLGAFNTLCLERAREEAVAAAAAYAGGAEARPLEGVPFGVKDLFDTAEVRTTYGSLMFADHVPDRDAEAVGASAQPARSWSARPRRTSSPGGSPRSTS